MGSTTVSRLTGEANAAPCLSLSAYFFFFFFAALSRPQGSSGPLQLTPAFAFGFLRAITLPLLTEFFGYGFLLFCALSNGHMDQRKERATTH